MNIELTGGATAVDAERLDLPETFSDDRAAFVRVRRNAVPRGALFLRSLITRIFKPRSGKRESRWMCDRSPRPGGVRDPASSSPTCIYSAVMLVMSTTAQFCRALRQFSIIGAYLPTVPGHTYYASFPSGFDDTSTTGTTRSSSSRRSTSYASRRTVTAHPTQGESGTTRSRATSPRELFDAHRSTGGSSCSPPSTTASEASPPW